MNPLSVGSIIAETLAWARARLDIVLGLALAVNALPLILVGYSVEIPPPEAFDATYIIVSLSVGSIAAIITRTMIFVRMVMDYSGTKLAHVSPWALTWQSFVPLFLLSIVVNLATFLGLLALIIPGIFIAIVLSVAQPALVAEKESIGGAIDRSLTLTKGYRWHILGLGLFTVVIVLSISLLWEMIARPFIGANAAYPLWYIIFSQVLNAGLGVLVIIGQMVLYRRLVGLHAGMQPKDVDVFD